MSDLCSLTCLEGQDVMVRLAFQFRNTNIRRSKKVNLAKKNLPGRGTAVVRWLSGDLIPLSFHAVFHRGMGAAEVVDVNRMIMTIDRWSDPDVSLGRAPVVMWSNGPSMVVVGYIETFELEVSKLDKQTGAVDHAEAEITIWPTGVPPGGHGDAIPPPGV